MSWASRRKATYTIIFLFIAISIAAFIVVSLFSRQPTCFDGIKNQNEQGVDCGGVCTILCRAEYVEPIVLWVRTARVLASGTYNVLAYAQNPNIGALARNVGYTFKVYDRENIQLYERTGVTSIPPYNTFTVFDDNINVHDKIPARVTFEFLPGYVWERSEALESGVSVKNTELIEESTAPKLFADLTNTTVGIIRNIESVAILYDSFDNAIAFSRTRTNSVLPGANERLIFTWPEALSSKVFRTEIISKVLPQ